MQKFTRPLTREIELAGERLALTLSEQGISVRPVGSRKPPWEMSWAAVVCQLSGKALGPGQQPSAEEAAAAIERLKKGESLQAPPSSMPEARRTAASPETAAPATDPARPADMRALLARLDNWLFRHRARYREGLQPGAGDSELQALASVVGKPLPEELQVLLTWHNGQSADFVGHFLENWDLMSANEIANVLGNRNAPSAPQAGWRSGWIPFLEDDVGDYVVLDTSQPGSPVLEIWQGRTEYPIGAPSLLAWVQDFVDAVEAGRYAEDPERGSFMRRST